MSEYLSKVITRLDDKPLGSDVTVKIARALCCHLGQLDVVESKILEASRLSTNPYKDAQAEVDEILRRVKTGDAEDSARASLIRATLPTGDRLDGYTMEYLAFWANECGIADESVSKIIADTLN